ncbi:MAG: phosphatase PAP2 family protein [Anaerolineae bacterium]|nr:phosphatase PAP2 family protein [Anaerolineae bacterium]MDW8069457.1 phosphatase PAP2 family protein [Anaerolineae bacterium]
MGEPVTASFWERLFHWDARLSARLALRARVLRWLATFFAHTGDAALWLAGAGTMWFLADAAFWRELAVRIITAMTAGGVASTALKWTFRRQRPPGPSSGLYFYLDRHALPSGHATRVACIMVVLTPLLPGWWASALLGLWAALVSFSRVALQIHYLLDILLGMAVGALVGLAVIRVL